MAPLRAGSDSACFTSMVAFDNARLKSLRLTQQAKAMKALGQLTQNAEVMGWTTDVKVAAVDLTAFRGEGGDASGRGDHARRRRQAHSRAEGQLRHAPALVQPGPEPRAARERLARRSREERSQSERRVEVQPLRRQRDVRRRLRAAVLQQPRQGRVPEREPVLQVQRQVRLAVRQQGALQDGRRGAPRRPRSRREREAADRGAQERAARRPPDGRSHGHRRL